MVRILTVVFDTDDWALDEISWSLPSETTATSMGFADSDYIYSNIELNSSSLKSNDVINVLLYSL